MLAILFLNQRKLKIKLPDIIFEDDNLKHMFAESDLSRNKRKNIYRRFVPKSEIVPDIDSFC